MHIRTATIVLNISLLLFINLNLPVTCAERESAWKKLTGSTKFDDEEAESFPVEAARKFGNDVVVDCRGYKVVDPINLVLRPLSIGNSVEIDSISDADGHTYALCSVPHGVVLKHKVRNSTVWQDMQVPAEVRSAPKDWLVTSGDGDLAIISVESFFVLRKKRWTKVKFWTKAALGKALRYHTS